MARKIKYILSGLGTWNLLDLELGTYWTWKLAGLGTLGLGTLGLGTLGLGTLGLETYWTWDLGLWSS